MLWAIAGILLLLVGTLAIRLAVWPARVGDTLHCRRCDYILSGLTAAPVSRCPECGATLTAPNVVHGERRRERGRIIRGVVVLVLGLGLLGVGAFEPLRTVNWYGMKPTGWVIGDLTSSTPELRDQAWEELTARRAAGRLSPEAQVKLDAVIVQLYVASSPTLPRDGEKYLVDRFGHLTPEHQLVVLKGLVAGLPSSLTRNRLLQLEWSGQLAPAHQAQLIDAALAAQAERKPGRALEWLVDYLGRREIVDQLTPAQRDRFFTGCFNPSLEVRPLGVAGEGVPYSIRLNGRGPSEGWWSRVSLLSRQVDDRPGTREGGSMSGSSVGGESSIGSTLKFDVPGRHDLKYTIELAVAAGESPTEPEKTSPRWTRRLTLTRPFEILPAGAPQPWAWVDDASLATAIRRSIVLNSVRASDQRFNAFAMTVQVEDSPANLAFEIFARTPDGKEYRLGSMTAFAGTRHNIGVSAETFPPGKRVGKVDVIFRSSEPVLKGTTDMYQAWRGEVVFYGVAVKAEKN